MPLSSSPHSSLLHSPGGGSRTSLALARPERADDDHLFNPPSDLVCPLTLCVFLDPVLTSAGTLYERSAITAHLERSNSDPLTRTPLINKSLTPVFVLRSRALEYRESTAKSCIERLCGGGGGGSASSSAAAAAAAASVDPVRYLRRAVELVADSGGCVQGLSPATVEYVLAHPSNAFDGLCLQVFAEGLLQGGYRDRAASIYASLLLLEGEAAADRATQAELLRSCLSCWTDGSNATCTSSSCREGSSSSQALAVSRPTAAAAAGGGAVAAVDEYVYEKLVALFEGRGSLMLVELAEHAALGDRFVLRLCEQLLFHPPPPSAGDFGAPRELFGGGGDGNGGSEEKRLLLKYVHVLTDSLQRRQSEAERRLAELERWRGGRQRGGASGSGSSGRWGGGSGGGAQGGRGLLLLPAWVRHPVAVAVLVALALSLPSDQPVGRVLRAAPYLALLPAGGGGAKVGAAGGSPR